VSGEEVAVASRRLGRLLARGRFPSPPTSSYPVIPWPPF